MKTGKVSTSATALPTRNWQMIVVFAHMLRGPIPGLASVFAATSATLFLTKKASLRATSSPRERKLIAMAEDFAMLL